MAEIEGYLSVGQAKAALGISRRLVHRLYDEGRLTGLSTALGRLIDPRSVERYRNGRQEKAAQLTGVAERPGNGEEGKRD